MDGLKVGMKHSLEWEVTENRCTTRGDYKVFSTPSMTQFVEMTAQALAAPYLKPGQGQVGVSVNIRHLAPTPIGKKVRADAELVGIDRRRLTFRVKVFDDVEQVGEAEHERFVIDVDKYIERLRKKIGASPSST
ncbi:MAG TPA: thioesterase family protein [Burkholderiales bacterium]|nr:thioesterase family protein [Burkholderiales bacterium]